MMTYLILSPSWQSTDKASRWGYLLDGIKSNLVTILEKFLAAIIMKVK